MHIPIPTITKIYLTNLNINTLEDFTCEKPYFYFIFIMMHKYVLFLSINIIKLIASNKLFTADIAKRLHSN